jgi:hypothetical protein
VGKDGSLVASVVGTVERVNKLVTVKGVGGVYNGEVGNNIGEYIIYDEITLVRVFNCNLFVQRLGTLWSAGL